MKQIFFITRRLFLGVFSLSIGASALTGAPWPQYRGLNSDGKTAEKISTKWPAAGSKEVWKSPMSAGFSSLTVGGGAAFTQISRMVEGANQEVLLAVDAASGKELWTYPLGPTKFEGGGDSGAEGNTGGDGPRSTPSYDGGRVYVMSAKLKLVCLDAKTGKQVWTRDLMKENAGRNISWLNAASPLIEGDLVFVAGGGEGQALLGIHKLTGAVVWKGQDDKMTHATPVAATVLGVRQVIFFTQTGLVAVVPASGEVLWRHDFLYKVSTAASPVVAGDVVYCSAGYTVGAGTVKITKESGKLKATELWRKPGKLMNHWSTPVFKDGYLYGMFGFKEYGSCPLKCVDLMTGDEVWSQPGFGPGNVTLADDKLVVLGDAGQLVVVEASPKAYTELARAKVVAGKCWSTPTVSDGKVFVRSTQEGVCVDVGPRIAVR